MDIIPPNTPIEALALCSGCIITGNKACREMALEVAKEITLAVQERQQCHSILSLNKTE